MDEIILTPAEKHYLSMKRAQAKYYEKLMGPVEDRKPRGRPRKTVVKVVQGINGLNKILYIE